MKWTWDGGDVAVVEVRRSLARDAAEAMEHWLETWNNPVFGFAWFDRRRKRFENIGIGVNDGPQQSGPWFNWNDASRRLTQ